MKREPAPALGAPFDANFNRIVAEAYDINPAVHDGAIVLARAQDRDAYRIVGWSVRLIPPSTPPSAAANRGSAYNSALAMSLVDDVDGVALIHPPKSELFLKGKSYDLGSLEGVHQ